MPTWEEIAERQAGVLTLEQALSAGVTRGRRQTLISGQRWEVVGRGVYHVRGAPPSWEQRAWIACLETGGVASHRTAAWLNRLEGIGRLDALLDLRSRSVDSALEVKLRRLLRTHHVPTPAAGVNVFAGGVYIAKLDFAWPYNRPRVAVMAQSSRWHGNTDRSNRD